MYATIIFRKKKTCNHVNSALKAMKREQVFFFLMNEIDNYLEKKLRPIKKKLKL